MNPLHVEVRRLLERLEAFDEAPTGAAAEALARVRRQALLDRLQRVRARLGRWAREPASAPHAGDPARATRAALGDLAATHADLLGARRQLAGADARVRFVVPLGFGLRAGSQVPVGTSREREQQRRDLESRAEARRKAARAAQNELRRDLGRGLDAWVRTLDAVAVDIRRTLDGLMAAEEERIEGLLDRLSTPALEAAGGRARLAELAERRRALAEALRGRPGRLGPVLRAGWLAAHHRLLERVALTAAQTAAARTALP